MRAFLLAILAIAGVARADLPARTQVCDKGFDCATVTGGKLDVNASVTVPPVHVDPVPLQTVTFVAPQHVVVDSMPAGGSGLTNSELRATPVPVSLSTLPALVAGSAVVGKVSIDQTTPGTTNLVQIGSTLPAFAATPTVYADLTDGTTHAMVKAGSTAAIASDPSLVVALSPNTAVTPPAITKGTQGTTGFTTQDLKDAGRSSVTLVGSLAATSTAEALIALNKSQAFGTSTACTSSSCAVTSAKTFRIQAIAAQSRNTTGSVAGNVTLKIRVNAAGACTTSSNQQASWTIALPASALATPFPVVMVPDGWEIPYGSGAQICISATDAHWVTGSQVATTEITVVGYEY